MARSRQTPECVFALVLVERHHRGDAPTRGVLAGTGPERLDVITVEAAWLDAFGLRDDDRLLAETTPQPQQFRPPETVGSALLAQRLGEQHRAIAELAP